MFEKLFERTFDKLPEGSFEKLFEKVFEKFLKSSVQKCLRNCLSSFKVWVVINVFLFSIEYFETQLFLITSSLKEIEVYEHFDGENELDVENRIERCISKYMSGQ